jgi:hypothetical protein
MLEKFDGVTSQFGFGKRFSSTSCGDVEYTSCGVFYSEKKYEFRVVMGLMVFQMHTSQVLEGLNWKYVLTYIDDIISIFRGDYKDHFSVLEKVLERLWGLVSISRREKGQIPTKEVE